MTTSSTDLFSRSFLDRLYAVVDLLTDRPEPKPPDSENPTSQPNMAAFACWVNQTWTKKWSFEHFIKRRRRKQGWLWLVLFCLEIYYFYLKKNKNLYLLFNFFAKLRSSKFKVDFFAFGKWAQSCMTCPRLVRLSQISETGFSDYPPLMQY